MSAVKASCGIRLTLVPFAKNILSIEGGCGSISHLIFFWFF